MPASRLWHVSFFYTSNTVAVSCRVGLQVEANVSCTDSCGQVAVQVTGVLRNLAVSSASAGSFVSAGVLPAMRAAAKVLWAQSEVVLNVGRVLSKLTLAEACTCAMEEDWDYAPLLVSAKLQMTATEAACHTIERIYLGAVLIDECTGSKMLLPCCVQSMTVYRGYCSVGCQRVLKNQSLCPLKLPIGMPTCRQECRPVIVRCVL